MNFVYLFFGSEDFIKMISCEWKLWLVINGILEYIVILFKFVDFKDKVVYKMFM